MSRLQQKIIALGILLSEDYTDMSKPHDEDSITTIFDSCSPGKKSSYWQWFDSLAVKPLSADIMITMELMDDVATECVAIVRDGSYDDLIGLDSRLNLLRRSVEKLSKAVEQR